MDADVMDDPVGLGESLKCTVRVRTLELPYRICKGMLRENVVLELNGMEKCCSTVLTTVLEIPSVLLKVIVHRILILLCLVTVGTDELSISVLGIVKGHAVNFGGQGASNLLATATATATALKKGLFT